MTKMMKNQTMILVRMKKKSDKTSNTPLRFLTILFLYCDLNRLFNKMNYDN